MGNPQHHLAVRFFARYAAIISMVLLFFLLVFYQHAQINSSVMSRSESERHREETIRLRHRHRLHRHRHEKPRAANDRMQMLQRAFMRHWQQHLRYSPPYQPKRQGLYFNERRNSPILRRLGLGSVSHCVKDAQSVKDVQFVTAVSHVRFAESLDLISTMQARFPNRTLLVYDIGLRMPEVRQLKRLCGVLYRKFVFVGYPAYTRILGRFYWKPLVLQTALNEFGAILWLEASSRIIMNDAMLATALQEAKRTGVKVFAGRHVYSTVTVTHPAMYRYLPTDAQRVKTSGQVQTAPMILINTKFVRNNVMQWYVLCGLERHCMAPLGSVRKCQKLRMRQRLYKSKYIGCHRYDQSALNILLKNAFDFDSAKFFNRRLRLVRLKRGHDPKKYTLRHCKA